jgi:acetyl/propionyl-CoA carboxylase alpha subunit
MRRALAEYEVRGIKTTIPFFQWVLDDEDFVAGRFDTGFIDRKLGARNGAPLREPLAEHHELAAIVAALAQMTLVPDGSAAGATSTSRWKDQARSEAVGRGGP